MVYVDDMNMSYKGMKMSHMIADTTEELYEMAEKIGVDKTHIQFKGTYKEHFDICKAKKQKALKFGALQITWRQAGEIIIKRKRT
ncbi:MAG: DUF4031 domain-containing protein [Cyanothece sp. SIO1E1]|nr:DUF4031 domain-containing protein [Cyanothece sp. SIO1E1]